jgi:enolase
MISTTNTRISAIRARQILDSRGRPTIEADVVLADGSRGRACAPSGASTGRHEAWELRDGDPAEYEGLGVLAAVGHVCGEICNALIDHDACDQAGIDQTMTELDGSTKLQRLGANGILATSLAVARAAAASQGIPLYRYIASLLPGSEMSLPMPMTNILSGGAHAGRSMDLQDFLAIPIGAQSYSQALQMISRVRSSAASILQTEGLSTLLADEGGLSPGYGRADRALETMVRAFEAAGLRPGIDMAITLDVAASELFKSGTYVLAGEQCRFASAEMIEFIAGLAQRYPIVSIEDALDQDDWDGWQALTSQLADIQLVGDDLFATNPDRIQRGIATGVANCALIKLNQNGTLSGTLQVIELAVSAGYGTVVSARSGETEDNFIADLAVGTGAGQIKIGSVRSSERMSKYNQLLRIEEEAGLPFAGTTRLAGRCWSHSPAALAL